MTLSDEQVDGEVLNLTTLATFGALLELVEALSKNRCFSERQLQQIHDRIAEPLDDERCRDDQSMCVIRQAADESFARSRALLLGEEANIQRREEGDD